MSSVSPRRPKLFLPMPSQAERRAATSQAILRAARSAFGRQGFDATSIDDIADAAGVSKGAVYHHVESKERLFREVLSSVLAELAERVGAASVRGDDPLERMSLGCREFLMACRQQEVRQIYLTDGPRVLGWEAWRALDLEHFLGVVQRGLEAGVRAGAIAPIPVAPYAQLLGAAITEAALLTARTRSRTKRQHVAEALDCLLDGLRPH